MKVKRFKKIQRHIKFFEKNFKFRSPYQILVDGTFAQAALTGKVNIRDQLPKYLDSAVKLLTTPCIVNETEAIGPPVYGALQILKQYPYHDCSHVHQKSSSASKCILAMVGTTNPNRYIIATQDLKLRERLRTIPGVAILHLHGNCPTLEKESYASEQFAKEKTAEQLEILDYQKEILTHMKQAQNIPDSPATATQAGVRKGTMKRKRQGPNPLSCKKSKKSSNSGGVGLKTKHSEGPDPASQGSVKKKKRRVRVVKVAKHVRQELVLSSPTA